MPPMPEFLDTLLHLDQHLDWLIRNYGGWTCLLLFALVFCETGLVVAFFLPTDGVLLAVGLFTAKGSFNFYAVWPMFVAAAILGDTTNYWIGVCLGPRLRREGRLPFIKNEHLDRVRRFYAKHGKTTILLARFLPLVRTLGPLLAGVGLVRYREFAPYNAAGVALWVSLYLGGSCFLGGAPIFRDRLSLFVAVIVGLSLLPLLYRFIRRRMDQAAPKAKDGG
ncbi:MAG: VTT domain-containing protein [Candidatus Sumerlaeota bacterium]|nr:VTT domain-containing protein [Candidatus Sumerlaeota bacterium]